MFQFLCICCLLHSFTPAVTPGLLHWTIASMLCVAASTSRTSREIPTRPGSTPPSLPSRPYSHPPRHSQYDNIWSSGWPQGRRATDVRNPHRLTDNIDVILEAHCIDAFSLYWHGRLQNPFIGRRIITLSLICGQLPIGSSSNDIQLLLVASSGKGTNMDKEGCSLQGQRAQESVCCSDCWRSSEHILGHASTEMAKPMGSQKMQRETKPTVSTDSRKPGASCVLADPACLSPSPALREEGTQARLNVPVQEASMFIFIHWSIAKRQGRFKGTHIYVDAPTQGQHYRFGDKPDFHLWAQGH